MRIYWIRAQAPRQVLALVKHLGLEAELVELDLKAIKTAEYSALNPNQKAPTLVDDDLVLWESSAIMAHLCIKAGSDMWPANKPQEQVEVLRWLSWNDCHWSRVVGPYYFEHIVKRTFGIGAPDRTLLQAKAADLTVYARVLEQHLEGKGNVACERLTISDFRLASMVADWKEAEMPLDDFPNIRSWIDGLMRIPAWEHPWPKGLTPDPERYAETVP